ncbi:protein-L-isoaspartate O-methyltransferase [Streptomyces sp. Y1]|uniref:Protein-L-isoaspartate O-methyltransferase n=1 Tax=Streptomyces sp. Y1 TaxID=3238634 RepID=A0AB39TPY3_9ACTN
MQDRPGASPSSLSPRLRAAVAAVPRPLFLRPGVFRPARGGWRTVTDTAGLAELADNEWPLVLQVEWNRARYLADQATWRPVRGLPVRHLPGATAVARLIEAADVAPGSRVLDIGAGTGYSTALLCQLGAEVTAVEADAALAGHARVSLAEAGYAADFTTSPSGPYERVIATEPVTRLPHGWVRWTAPGGTITATLGTALVRLTARPDGTADGRVLGPSPMPPRVTEPYPWSGIGTTPGRDTRTPPSLLTSGTPALLAQLAFPGCELHTTLDDCATVHLLHDPARRSLAEVVDDTYGWTVREYGPVKLWEQVERLVAAWREAGSPDLTAVRLHLTEHTHTYRLGDHPDLRWEHPAGP